MVPVVTALPPPKFPAAISRYANPLVNGSVLSGTRAHSLDRDVILSAITREPGLIGQGLVGQPRSALVEDGLTREILFKAGISIERVSMDEVGAAGSAALPTFTPVATVCHDQTF